MYADRMLTRLSKGDKTLCVLTANQRPASGSADTNKYETRVWRNESPMSGELTEIDKLSSSIRVNTPPGMNRTEQHDYGVKKLESLGYEIVERYDERENLERLLAGVPTDWEFLIPNAPCIEDGFSKSEVDEFK